jgi:hypothetical protein
MYHCRFPFKTSTLPRLFPCPGLSIYPHLLPITTQLPPHIVDTVDTTSPRRVHACLLSSLVSPVSPATTNPRPPLETPRAPSSCYNYPPVHQSPQGGSQENPFPQFLPSAFHHVRLFCAVLPQLPLCRPSCQVQWHRDDGGQLRYAHTPSQRKERIQSKEEEKWQNKQKRRRKETC